MSTQARKPAGSAGSTGGQFAPQRAGEADVALREPRPSDIFFEAELDERLYTSQLAQRLADLYPATPRSDINAWAAYIDGTYSAHIMDHGGTPTQNQIADMMDPVMAAIADRDQRHANGQDQVGALSEHQKYLTRLAFFDPNVIAAEITSIDPDMVERVHAAGRDIHALAGIAANLKGTSFTLDVLARDYGPSGTYSIYRQRGSA